MTGLYIHIPFCVQKCNYCDFVSFINKNTSHSAYIDALEKEMLMYKGKKIDTIFIGGGTPTVLSHDELERIVFMCHSVFDISANCEWTIESNPKTLTKEVCDMLLKNGVNRISVGVQSFNDEELAKIGRIHTAQEAYNTLCQVKQWGFSNINIDLMMALPEQTMDTLTKTLEKAMEINPTHISCYSLIIEENTPFFKQFESGLLNLPDEQTDRLMYSYVCQYLKEHGYEQYEISNFAKKGYECNHNIGYWKCQDYIGVGVSAHSYLDGSRFYNTNDLTTYLSGDGICQDKISLSVSDKMEEFMIMGLRMTEGVAEEQFFKRFHIDMITVYQDALDKYVSLGLLIYENGRYFLSSKGVDISNSILCDFILSR